MLSRVVRVLPAAAVCLLLTGCAVARLDPAVFQAQVTRGEYDAALAALQATEGEDDVAALLDRGLLLQALGRWDESEAMLRQAEIRAQDLYTRSLSRQALALVTSDRTLPYRPPGFEYAYIAYYRAWNYLERGRVDDVLVEARKLSRRLDDLAAACPDSSLACGDTAFLRWFCGLLFEWGGEPNAAYVAYRKAERAASRTGELGLAAPPGLGRRLVRLARSLGFSDEEAFYAGRYGDAGPAEGSATLVVLLENGVVGHREEVVWTVPIFSGETKRVAADPAAWAGRLALRAGPAYPNREFEYLLRVALPRYVASVPAAEGAELQLDGRRERTERVEDLSALAALALERSWNAILTRAVARALAKYLAKRTTDKKVGRGAGLLVNLLGAAAEAADTRSWRSLPAGIQAAVLEVPPGRYRARLRIVGRGGETLGTVPYPDLVLRRGGIAFLRHRAGP